MNERRQMAGLLRAAAKAMPATERLRFSRYLRGLEKRGLADLVPGTPLLPPITVLRAPAPERKPVESVPECWWYYGEACSCSRGHGRPARDHGAPVQLWLDLSHRAETR